MRRPCRANETPGVCIVSEENLIFLKHPANVKLRQDDDMFAIIRTKKIKDYGAFSRALQHNLRKKYAVNVDKKRPKIISSTLMISKILRN